MSIIPEFPIRFDITIRKGTLYERVLKMEYEDEDGLLQLLDTEGYTALMQARETPEANKTVLSIGTHNARIITGIQSDSYGSWNLHIRIPATDTAGEQGPPGGFVGVYDLELEPPGDPGGRFALLAGTFRVEPEVSR